MSQHSIYVRLLGTAGLVGLLAVVPGAPTGSAQSVNEMVRTLNNVLNPGDAQRLEDQARRNGRSQEERYWRDYRAGLDSPNRYGRDYRDRDSGDYRSRGDYRGPVTKVIVAIAATGVTIVTREIIATTNAESLWRSGKLANDPADFSDRSAMPLMMS
jgi:hypothetical protein